MRTPSVASSASTLPVRLPSAWLAPCPCPAPPARRFPVRSSAAERRPTDPSVSGTGPGPADWDGSDGRSPTEVPGPPGAFTPGAGGRTPLGAMCAPSREPHARPGARPGRGGACPGPAWRPLPAGPPGPPGLLGAPGSRDRRRASRVRGGLARPESSPAGSVGPPLGALAQHRLPRHAAWLSAAAAAAVPGPVFLAGAAPPSGSAAWASAAFWAMALATV